MMVRLLTRRLWPSEFVCPSGIVAVLHPAPCLSPPEGSSPTTTNLLMYFHQQCNSNFALLCEFDFCSNVTFTFVPTWTFTSKTVTDDANTNGENKFGDKVWRYHNGNMWTYKCILLLCEIYIVFRKFNVRFTLSGSKDQWNLSLSLSSNPLQISLYLQISVGSHGGLTNWNCCGLITFNFNFKTSRDRICWRVIKK